MKKQKLIYRLFFLYISLAVGAIFLIVLFASNLVEQFYFDQKIDDLRVRSILVSEILHDPEGIILVDLQYLVTRIGHETKTRITLIDHLGKVLADSEGDPLHMNLHNDRPEIILALKEGVGVNRRWSFTLEQEHLYFARVIRDLKPPIVVRISVPTEALHEALHSIKLRLSIIGAIVVILMAAVNWYVSRVITRPIQVMEAGAKRFARGKLKIKVPESDIYELGSLARSLNEMAEQIFDRIRLITQQKNEQIAILSSMNEGVIALDSKGMILSINRAAAVMFGLKLKQVKYRPIHEVIRHVALNEFVLRVSKHKHGQDCRITLYEPEERILNVIGTRMPSKKGANGGVVIVFTDLTQLQKLEGVRREFVANVSHELKTPITSILGYVETLQGGAMRDPKDARHFLEIISKHSNRLGQIVDDLLELSRIEEISPRNEKQYLENVFVGDLIESILSDYQSTADLKEIAFKQEIAGGIQILVNPKLVTLAIGNLIDNALKYSGNHSEVLIRCQNSKKKVILDVIDSGPGIEKEHLPRIFERFYRIDKGRSREVGGTGLGLSIVKHIVRIHDAEIQVKSTLGEGTTFSITFIKY
ncbi:MAG: ATP-binding protein [Candidatus Marinimicrobia bacterium]|nr:ATP-binding protein [Candidatus Neomarinimicrobiota bacterium]